LKNYKKLSEAKVTRNLTDTYPATKGEQHFVDKHIEMDILKNFRQKGNDEMFNGKIVKIFPRDKNRFGYDEKQSIQKYDESENLLELMKSEMKKKKSKRHIFINGEYQGTTTWTKNNKDTIKNWSKEHPGTHPTQIKVTAESTEINEISKELLNRYLQKSITDHGFSHFITKNTKGEEKKYWDKKTQNRKKGISAAINKLDKKEEVNEISKELTGRYAKKTMNESLAKDTLKRFSDSKGKMKTSDEIDKKDKKDKVKEFIAKLRKKK
jgi:hypothetical protein